MVKTYKLRVLRDDDSEVILIIKALNIFDARKFSGIADNKILSVIRVNAKTGNPIKSRW